MKFSMTSFWSPRIRSTFAGLAQARVRAPQHLLEVLRAPGQAGAELGDDQPKRSR